MLESELELHMLRCPKAKEREFNKVCTWLASRVVFDVSDLCT